MTKSAVISAMKGCTSGFKDDDKPLKMFRIRFEDCENGGYTHLKFAVPVDWVNNLNLCLTWNDGEKDLPKSDWNITLDILNNAIREHKIAMYNIA